MKNYRNDASEKKIYLVFSCDARKSRFSERLIMATTSIHKLKSFLAREIVLGNIGYSSGATETPKTPKKNVLITMLP